MMLNKRRELFKKDMQQALQKNAAGAALGYKAKDSHLRTVMGLESALEMLQQHFNHAKASKMRYIGKYKKQKNEVTESVDLCFTLNLDARKSDQNVRSFINVKNGRNNIKVAVLTGNDEQKNKALAAGADFVDYDAIIKMVDKKIRFDYVVATPDVMPLSSNVTKVLGAKKIMPTQKLGTLGPDAGAMVANLKSGIFNATNSRGSNGVSVLSGSIGRITDDMQDLLKNCKYVISQVLSMRPSSIKGDFILGVYLKTTHSPSVHVSWK